MKRIICLLLCLALVVSMTACTSSAKVSALEARLAELEGQNENDQGNAGVKQVIAVNAKVYLEGESAASASAGIEFMDPIKIIVTPELPEGKVVRLWSVNGQEFEAVQGEDLKLEVSDTTVVKAVLRDELKVTTINAHMQFLDRYGDPTGEEFDEYVFEYDDENVSNQVITVYVEAEVPSGYTVDYWKINEIPYYFNRTVTAFTVEELDETTVYEVVLKKVTPPASTPQPGNTPEPTSTPEPTKTPTPFKTPSRTFLIPSFPVISFRPLIPTPTPYIVK